MTKEFLEGCLAEGMSLDKIGALTGKHPSTVSYHLQKHGLRPENRAKYASKGGLSRDVLEGLVAEGLSLRGMARRLDRSPSTVRHWLDKHGLRSRYRDRNRELIREARAAGRNTAELTCRRHGPTEYYLAPNGSYCCKRCRRERVAEWRRRAKRRLVEEAGGRCVVCGYDAAPAALHFHHLDPSKKSFGLAMAGNTRAFERMREEAKKCVLLCGNCHAEVELGLTQLPQSEAVENESAGANLTRKAA